MKKLSTSLFTGLLALSLIATPAFAATPTERSISVSAVGKYQVKPDIAVITIGVETQGKTAGATQRANRAQVQSLMEKLTSFSVKKEDIQNTWYSIYPQYDYTDPNNRKLTGYIASQNLSVKVANLDKVTDLLDAVSDNDGIISINNVEYRAEKAEKAVDAARELAVKEAASKAEKLAKAIGKKVGEVMTISESTDSGVIYGGASGGMVDAKPASLIPGSVEITVWLNVMYELVK